MKRCSITLVLLLVSALGGVRYAAAGQAPAAASDPDIPISHRDRVYSADQFSNTVSVTDPRCRPSPVGCTSVENWQPSSTSESAKQSRIKY